MSTQKEYTYITLAQRPKTTITSETFQTQKASFSSLTSKLSSPESDNVLVQTNYLSLDPAMRGWLNDTRSYVPPVQIGEIMRAGGIGTVIKASDRGKLKVGDLVYGTLGWSEFAAVKEKNLEKIELPPGAETLDFLGPLGTTGLTAYFGLLDVGQPKAGETLVVTGAAGATGSVVCQIGKLKGLKVIAIAGSDDKCSWLEDEIGVDKALNYKSPTFAEDFKKLGYLDVMFDNVGGDILNLALTRLNKNARIVLCGAISQYNTAKPTGLTSYMTLISQRAKMQGFIVFDYAARYDEAKKDISEWIKEGKIKRKFHVVSGLESCPETLQLLFSGGNTGKLIVKVADETRLSRL